LGEEGETPGRSKGTGQKNSVHSRIGFWEKDGRQKNKSARGKGQIGKPGTLVFFKTNCDHTGKTKNL